MNKQEINSYLDSSWTLEPIDQTRAIWNFIPAAGNVKESFCSIYILNKVAEVETLAQQAILEFEVSDDCLKLRIGNTIHKLKMIDSGSFTLTNENIVLKLKRRNNRS